MKRCMKMLMVAMAVMVVLLSCSGIAFAEDATQDALTQINNITNLVYTIIKVIGGCIVAWGVFQFATSLNSHDTNQKVNSLMLMAGGVLCLLVESIVQLITG